MASKKSRSRRNSCLARRQVPLMLEPGLTMIMAMDESCLACGGSGGQTPLNNGDRTTTDRAEFLRKLKKLDRSELSKAFTVTFKDIISVVGVEIPCVGCRRSVEDLLKKLYDNYEFESLDPLLMGEGTTLSVAPGHLRGQPAALANLFVDQVSRLEAAIQSKWPGASGSKRNSKFGGRCATHSLDIDRRRGGGSSAGGGGGIEEVHWIDTWDSMVRECQEEVVQIHFDALRDTLDRYLKRHNFCSECASNVNEAEAYSTLVGESDDDEASCSSVEDNEKTPPALRSPTPSTESIDSLQSSRPASPMDPPPASPGSFKEEVKERFMQAVERVKRPKKKVPKGITACPEDQHIHVQCCPIFVSKLITMAEPHLSGIKVERCARTVQQAQKEVLICIGICLHDRLQRIQRRLREGQQSCDLLFLMALKSLKKSFELAFGMSDLEKFCLELDEEDRRKKEQAQKKRDKKSKQKQNKNNKKEKENSSSTNNETGGSQVDAVQNVKPVLEPSNENNNNQPRTMSGKGPKKGEATSTSRAQVDTSTVDNVKSVQQGVNKAGLGLTKKKCPATKSSALTVHDCPNLETMLELMAENKDHVDIDEPVDEDVEHFIPLEDIRAFQARHPELAQKREECRKNLRMRFDQLCTHHKSACQ